MQTPNIVSTISDEHRPVMSMMQQPGSVEDRRIIARLSMICKFGNGHVCINTDDTPVPQDRLTMVMYASILMIHLFHKTDCKKIEKIFKHLSCKRECEHSWSLQLR
jgi:hypothetical protein